MTSSTQVSTKRQRPEKLFHEKVFVISNTYKGVERKRIQQLIESNGGKVKTKFPSDYMVQSFLDDDDDRLGEAHDCGALVVSLHYLEHCLEKERLVGFTEYALGEFESKEDEKNELILEQMKNGFSEVRDEAREYEEQPQTFHDFMHMERYEPDETRKVMYLVRIQSHMLSRTTKQKKLYDYSSSPSMESIVQFCTSYFSSSKLDVKLLDIELSIDKVKSSSSKTVDLRLGNIYLYPIHIRRLKSMDNIIRLNGLEILDVLEENLPKDGYCILAITDEDIYEVEDDDTVIMGRATGDRVGIVSLFRFNPSLNDEKMVESKSKSLWLSRVMKTVAHESMHMMGLDHCCFYNCVMNACVENEEDHKESIFLCPIDLRKLQASLGFDIEKRYRDMLQFFETHNMASESNWLNTHCPALEPAQ